MNKIQKVQILGHEVQYTGNGYETYETGLNNGAISDIADAIRKGYNCGELIPGSWWIVDWKEISKELYKALIDTLESPIKVSIECAKTCTKAMNRYEEANK